jgi:hypothetical protein
MLAILSATALISGTATICLAGLNLNVDVGVPAPAPPVYLPPAAYAPPEQLMLPAAPPQFVFVPELGYYVAVGTPYDIAYIGHDYFMYSNGFWYRAAYYGGPLLMVDRRAWPSLLARHSFRDFRRFRDAEFRRYERDRAHYGGQLHKPQGKG